MSDIEALRHVIGPDLGLGPLWGFQKIREPFGLSGSSALRVVSVVSVWKDLPPFEALA